MYKTPLKKLQPNQTVMSCISCFILKSYHAFVLSLMFHSSCESPASCCEIETLDVFMARTLMSVLAAMLPQSVSLVVLRVSKGARSEQT